MSLRNYFARRIKVIRIRKYVFLILKRHLTQAFIGKKGLALLEQIDKKLPALDSEMGNLTDKEAQILNQLLNKMRYRAD